MESKLVEIRVEGKTRKVPSICIDGRRIIVIGKWIKRAAVQDEDLDEGKAIENPEFLISELKQGKLNADMFTFAQKLSDPKPKHQYYMEWDNAAVIPLKDFSDWWEKRLSQDTRRNVRRAAKMGVTVKTARFDDDLVKGIVKIYDETAVRQGKPFWHYRKGFEVVKSEAGTYLDRSEFIGAYFGDALIGFIKLTYGNGCAHIIHILSKEEHTDKRPTNALIDKAVEVCVSRGLSYLTYCKYIDGGNEKSALTEFKRRNGFEQLLYPRYFVPLTVKGRIALRLRFHHGWRNALPKGLVPILLNLRAWFFSFAYRKTARSGAENISQSAS